MNDGGYFWIAAASLLLAGFAAVGARAMRNFSRHDLEEFCRRRRAQSLFGEILRRHERFGVAVETVLVLAASLAVLTGTLWLWRAYVGGSPAPGWTWLALATVGWGFVLATAVLWLPATIARLWAEPFLYYTWPFWRVVAAAMTPLVWCAEAIDLIFHRLAGREREKPNGDTIEEEIRTIVTEGHREGLLEEDAREMIEGVMELADADVSEIMTPRTDMQMMHVGLSWDEMLRQVIDGGHTRIPVYEKNRDDIVGVLYSKDLLIELAKEPGEPRRALRKILRRAHFVPETKAVDDLLAEFQKTHNHMAIVLDEYGGVSGLVTIEDVLEEIVGEIVDEYDEAIVEEITPIDPATCIALGRAHIDEINQHLGLDLPEDQEFDTIAGFVFSELGRVPSAGDSLTWRDKARVTVLEASHRRIEKVRIEVVGQEAKEIA